MAKAICEVAITIAQGAEQRVTQLRAQIGRMGSILAKMRKIFLFIVGFTLCDSQACGKHHLAVRGAHARMQIPIPLFGKVFHGASQKNIRRQGKNPL
jgi:hypothetical protein